MALGAERADVRRLVVAIGLWPVAIGVVAGIPMAGLVGSTMRAFLPGISAWDPIALMSAAAVLIGTAVVATVLPARRAGRLDPMRILRLE